MSSEEDRNQDGVDLLEALMLAGETVIVVDSSGGEGGDEETPEELAAVIYQMERALAAFRGED